MSKNRWTLRANHKLGLRPTQQDIADARIAARRLDMEVRMFSETHFRVLHKDFAVDVYPTTQKCLIGKRYCNTRVLPSRWCLSDVVVNAAALASIPASSRREISDHARSVAATPKDIKRVDYHNNDSYAEYRRSVVFSRKAERYLDEVGSWCAKCKERRCSASDVYHTKRDRIPSEPLRDLVAICQQCVHGVDSQSRDSQ